MTEKDITKLIEKTNPMIATETGLEALKKLAAIAEKEQIKQVSKSFERFCFAFRVHASACNRQRSAAVGQTEV